MHNDNLWFANARVETRLSNRDNAAGMSLLEHVMEYGFSPPLHTHHAEDETFYMIEGEVRFEVNGESHVARAGEAVHAPAGSRHSFVVTSPSARFLTVTQGGFEDMVREASRPAGAGLPEPAIPTPDQQRKLAEACRRNGIELLGAQLAA